MTQTILCVGVRRELEGRSRFTGERSLYKFPEEIYISSRWTVFNYDRQVGHEFTILPTWRMSIRGELPVVWMHNWLSDVNVYCFWNKLVDCDKLLGSCMVRKLRWNVVDSSFSFGVFAALLFDNCLINLLQALKSYAWYGVKVRMH